MVRLFSFLAAGLLLVLPGTLTAQTAPGDTGAMALRSSSPDEEAVSEPEPIEALDASSSASRPLYYVAGGSATLFREADSSQAYVKLGFREPVRVLEREGAWRKVRTQGGARGYVKAQSLSNIWIRVAKQEQTVYVYRGAELLRTVPADLGNNIFSDKARRGDYTMPDHWRTPEGRFFVVEKKEDSQYHRALLLNYPTAEDAHRGLREGLISREEFQAIIQADKEQTRPPMYTALGGLIEIHGDGTGGGTNWTNGCVALRNDHMDQLWRWVRVGTPVLIER